MALEYVDQRTGSDIELDVLFGKRVSCNMKPKVMCLETYALYRSAGTRRSLVRYVLLHDAPHKSYQGEFELFIDSR